MQKAYEVFHRGEHKTTVYFTGYEDAEEVKKSLIEHDGYPPSIIVVERKGK